MRIVLLPTLFALLANPLLATNLDLSGSYSFQINSSRTTVVIEADRISNRDSNRSGTIRLELWATSSPVVAGQAWTGYRLATHQLSPLQGNTYYYDITSGTISFRQAPAGTWYYNLLLTEYTGSSLNDGYVSRDVGVFNGFFDGDGDQVSNNPDPTPNPSNPNPSNPTPWETPSGAVQTASWTPRAGDILTIEIREISGQVVPPGTIIRYVFETDSRFYAEGGSSSVTNPQAQASTTTSSDRLEGVTQPCILLNYDYSVYADDPNAYGRNCLFFYDSNSGVFSAYDQDSSGSGNTRGTFTLERANPGSGPGSARRYFDNATPASGGAYFDANLGFFYPVESDNWSYNYNLGWMYAVGDYNPDLWLYRVTGDNWVYVTRDFQPWVYFNETGRWYYFDYQNASYTPSN